MKTKIYVTQKRIYEGKPGKPSCCAVALAINIKLKPEYKAFMYYTRFEIAEKDGRFLTTIKVEDRISEFVKHFDNMATRNSRPKPIRFDVDIPTKYLKHKKGRESSMSIPDLGIEDQIQSETETFHAEQKAFRTEKRITALENVIKKAVFRMQHLPLGWSELVQEMRDVLKGETP